ncbi:hypothetical protein F4801DRAFT_579889 [Xylaria longipes]|nr:hypothetical protein F4801DRAFT_579889 [Xylaria longipes]RYC60064.1 hypothetical protein CHU98_g6149 [Xylaria longipes]
MAPRVSPPSTLVLESRAQIMDNCEFLVNKDDMVQMIISKDPLDKFFKAWAIKCNEDTREVMLASELCVNAQKAVESLHTKSCEATHNYITTNGFSAPRDLKAALLEPSGDDDDTASVISSHSDTSTAALSEWGSSGDEAIMLHASNPNETPKVKRPAGHQENRTATSAGSPHEPVGGSRSEATMRNPRDTGSPTPPRLRAVRPARPHSPSFVYSQGPQAPPPYYYSHSRSNGSSAPPPLTRGMPPLPHHPHPARMGPGPHHPSRMPNGIMPSIPGAHPFTYLHLSGDRVPFPVSQGGIRPPVPPGPINNAINCGGIKRGEHYIWTVGLTVHWVGHGQHRFMTYVQPTLRALQDKAIAAVRQHPENFTGEDPGVKEASRLSNKDGGRPTPAGPTAHVRKGMVAGVVYDIQGVVASDLSALFEMMARDGLPTFEVVVDMPYFEDVDENEDESEDEASVRGSTGSKESLPTW